MKSFLHSVISRSRLAGSRMLAVAGLPVAIATSSAAAAAAPAPLPAPPVVTVLKSSHRVARGLIFVAPKVTAANTVGTQGPEIIDDQGRPIWFQPVDADAQATDFRVQRYRDEPVLTYWLGTSHTGAGHGEGVDYVLDQSYRVIATVKAGGGLDADSHEFHLTPRNTALITVYHAVPYDLSTVGGSANGQVFDGIVQELDVATGRVLFEWHSLDHVGLDESQSPVPTSASTVYDYFHINAVNLDDDGNLIISARNTWAVYKLDHRTGDVIYRLSGKKSDFKVGPGASFAWQHNPFADGWNTVRIFDNESNIGPSRVIWVRHDLRDHTATLVRAIEHPDQLSAGSQGNSQALYNDDVFVGWGATGRISEFDANGNLLFDASVPTGYDTYRAYRFEWNGRPASRPTATIARGEGSPTVHAIWNGATDVARWVVLGGGARGPLVPIATAAWNGLDTAIPVKNAPARVEIVAFDAFGRLIGTSDTAQPAIAVPT
jgi:hypothetical protein